ncbi:MAG: hypothetical protein WC750_02160 [Patescibacteria group bacterium]|jgi:hypothetical protein
MNNQTSISRYILVILSISIAFTALVLIALNSWVQNKKMSTSNSGVLGQVFSNQAYENGYKAGYLLAREKYKKIAPLPEGAVVTSLTGTVTKVEVNQLTLTAENLDTNEFIDNISNDRTVLVNASTTVVSRTFLTAEEQVKQLERWSKSGSKNAPPLPYTEKAIKLSDIKPDQKITVMANEDIRLKQSFEATQIILTQTP